MTKRILTVLPLLCVLMFAMGGIATAPTAAAPTTLSTPDSTPDDFGGCRWYCGSKSYRTAAECAAHCSTTCEDIC
ncbi:MAG TPA: hypothetical protein VMQ62_07975 [Dongiaceae bacterium]|nr:hypothetical protein [Dongiaceae bacterium]